MDALETLPGTIDTLSALGIAVYAIYNMGASLKDSREFAQQRERILLEMLERLCNRDESPGYFNTSGLENEP